MNQLKKLVPDIVAIVLFAIISVAYFFPAITEGRILAQHDAVAGIGAGREHQEYYESMVRLLDGQTHCLAVCRLISWLRDMSRVVH